MDWIVALLVAGIILVLLEILFVPGVGITGILGFIALAIAIFLIGRDYGPLHAAGVFVGSLTLFTISFILFFRSPASTWLVHSEALNVRDRGEENPFAVTPKQIGTATTDLYPTGKARFETADGEKIYDVIASGEFIDEGMGVEVVRLEGNRIFVRRKKEEEKKEV